MAGFDDDALASRLCDGDCAFPALMSKIPWTDVTVLVLLDDPDARRIVAEGTLRQMLNRVAARSPAEWHRFSISLPDRNVESFSYRASEFDTLIRALAG